MAQLMTEMVGGEPYHYYPFGAYVVRAPGVCGGRPTLMLERHVCRNVAGGFLTEAVSRLHVPDTHGGYNDATSADAAC